MGNQNCVWVVFLRPPTASSRPQGSALFQHHPQPTTSIQSNLNETVHQLWSIESFGTHPDVKAPISRENAQLLRWTLWGTAFMENEPIQSAWQLCCSIVSVPHARSKLEEIPLGRTSRAHVVPPTSCSFSSGQTWIIIFWRCHHVPHNLP